jgi:hypothetical protein
VDGQSIVTLQNFPCEPDDIRRADETTHYQ